MNQLVIHGGKKLSGTVRVSGAKNAALPLLMATLLTDGACVLRNVPDLEDISVTLRLLQSFGANISFRNHEVTVTTKELTSSEAPYALVKAMRASFWVLGPLLARSGHARVALPGGDAIGTRPVDLHIKGLSLMGAEFEMRHGVLFASAPSGLQPAEITLDFPSVGATHQLLMAAARTPGRSVLRGAAREPEVAQLAQFLSLMGAEIGGDGSDEITIDGTENLNGATIEIIGDRIEAATYLAAGAVTGGSVEVIGIEPSAFSSTLDVLERAGCVIDRKEFSISLVAPESLQAVTFSTGPFPEVATDVQPILMATLTRAAGESIVHETVFENRFGHVAEFRRFGADISLEGRFARVRGVKTLSGAPVEARDIRAAVALVLMGLMSEGETAVTEIHHLERGYESLVEKFRSLGADLTQTPVLEMREVVLGC